MNDNHFAICPPEIEAAGIYFPSEPDDQKIMLEQLGVAAEIREKHRFLSPIPVEQAAQIAALKRIWPHWPDESPDWRYFNGLLYLAEAHLKSQKDERTQRV